MTRPTPATYQIEGARFLLSRQKAILGDDIGLGKTYTAILAADQVPGEKLIVCPKSLISQWVEQLQVFSANPGLYTVCNYESLKKYAYARTVIFDEATYIKSPKAQRTVTALEYALEADFVFFLTATPVRNHMPDFFTMFYVIFPDLKRSNTGHLPTDLYRSYKKWLYENFDIFYHEIDGKVIEKVKSLNPGAERVIGPMIAHALLKRSKSMLNLPPLTQEIVAVSWAPGQRQAYEAVLRNVLEMSDGEAQKIDHMLARMTRLRQAALDPSLFGGVEASGKTAWLKR